ncbi:MAG: oligosaccharide flippase family protein [Ignavibacteriae bacterium]|nr:oligosaccharide flippase family protein [Ignavibacteriota bacterium]
MLQQLKRLGTETAIYGISTILGRFLNFLLVPFYTNVLQPGEYGIVTYVYSLIAFANVLYSYGMETAYFKYSSTLEIGTRGQNFSTPFLSLVWTSILFSLFIALITSPIAEVIDIPFQHGSIILYVAGILAFDTIAIIPFAVLRMEHKAKLFAMIKVFNILINVVLNIWLLVFLKTGIEGIFISGLTASAVTLMTLFPVIIRRFTSSLDFRLLKALLKFGLPYIPAGLATMAVQVIDRPILRALTDDATVGIYQANYRLGIFMMLIVSMYDYAWKPFYFSIAKEPNAKEIFARVLTYLLFFMSAIFLVLTFFIEDIVKISFFGRHLIHPSYWDGLSIVPIVLLGYLFLGISTNLSAGIYLEKKTYYTPPISFLGALVNVAANYLLIPSMGMFGAAWATLLAYVVMAVALYVVVQKVYPVKYEFGRFFKIASAVSVVMVVYYYVPFGDLGVSDILIVGWKLALLALFLLLMYLMKFFEGRELSTFKRLFQARKTDEIPVLKRDEMLDERSV